MKIEPIEDALVIRLPKEEGGSGAIAKGGISFPEIMQHGPKTGEVVAAGPGKTDLNGNVVPSPVKVGDKVLFGSYAGEAVSIDGEKYMVARTSNIMGIIHD